MTSLFFLIYFFLSFFIFWLPRVLVMVHGIFAEACGIFCCSTWDLLLQCTDFSLVVACRFSLSSCGARAPARMGSVVVTRGLSCPTACGILVPRPGIEPTSLHWKVDSLPLGHQGGSQFWKFLSSSFL